MVSICKEVFNRGDDFVQKITGKVDRPLQKIREFRNRPNPAIAVTVDLLTTGIDIPAIEFVVFMGFVKSRILWVQMLERGTRLCKDIDKTHFKVFDCFNGSLVEYFADTTDFRFVPPRQQAMPLSQVVGNIVYDVDRERHLDMLNRRLHRVDRSIAPFAREQLDLYLDGASNKGLARTFQDLFDEQPEDALSLLQDEEFIDFLENYPRRRATVLIAEEVEDSVSSEVVIQGQRPEGYLDAFYRFVEENSQEIEALKILRQRPQDWGVGVLEELRSKLRENRWLSRNPSLDPSLRQDDNGLICYSESNEESPIVRGFKIMKKEHNYYVYIMTNKSKTLYTGMTNDLLRRVYEHKHKLVEGFTKKYNITKLVFFDQTSDVNEACRAADPFGIALEKKIKGWTRAKKIALIESQNPNWLDLSQDWY